MKKVALLLGIAGSLSVHPAMAGGPQHAAQSATLQVQIADSVGLAQPAPAPIAAGAVVLPAAIGLAPAPVPNQDVDDPSRHTVKSASLSPALLSRNDVFEGDGFSFGSNADHGIDERTPPAPGLNLSVPVK